MKTWYCFLFTILFSIFSFGQTKGKESILIQSINFYTTTIISVPCESFATQFKDNLRINEIYAEDSIAILDQFIKKIKFSKNRNAGSVNTRAKLIYKNKNGKEIIICVDRFNAIIDGHLAKKNKLFLKFILSLIPEEQLRFDYPKVHSAM